MWVGLGLCALCIILGVWVIIRGKYLTAFFEFALAIYGALFAELGRRESHKRKSGD